jgi:rod shape-determining protein MreC
MSVSFRKYQNFIVVSFLVILALSIYLSNPGASDTTSFPRRLALSIYSPPLRAIRFLLKGASRLWDNYIFLLETQKKNLELQKSMDLLAEQNMRMQEVLAENLRLRKLLSLKELSSARPVSAEIIGRDPIGWFKTLLINKGSSDGIGRNQAVVTHRGIVGRTLDVAGNSSKVLLITDINSSVDALVQRTRARGVVEGRASNLCELKYVSVSDDLKLGDLVVTSGLCGIFPKGLPVGKVSRMEKDNVGLFQYVELTPTVSLNKLEEVSILFAENN